jgi:hypothetical protein
LTRPEPETKKSVFQRQKWQCPERDAAAAIEGHWMVAKMAMAGMSKSW